MMNDIAEQMKQEVGALMSGQPGESNDGNTHANTDVTHGGNGADTSDSGGDQQAIAADAREAHEQLSERDQRELDKAIASGWKTPEDFHGHPEDFIKPREWNRTVALYRRLDREAEARRKLEEQVGTFGDRVKNVMEVAKQKAIAELEAKKREAVESADYGEVQRLDSEIKQTNDDYTVETPEPVQQGLRPEVEDWMAENTWFEQDQAMTQEALRFQQAQLMALNDPSNPSTDELRHALKETTNYMKYRFPDKFKRQPRHVAQSLETGRTRNEPRKLGYNDLTPEEKTVLENIERLPGGMSRDEYIQAVQDMRGMK